MRNLFLDNLEVTKGRGKGYLRTTFALVLTMTTRGRIAPLLGYDDVVRSDEGGPGSYGESRPVCRRLDTDRNEFILEPSSWFGPWPTATSDARRLRTFEKITLNRWTSIPDFRKPFFFCSRARDEMGITGLSKAIRSMAPRARYGKPPFRTTPAAASPSTATSSCTSSSTSPRPRTVSGRPL